MSVSFLVWLTCLVPLPRVGQVASTARAPAPNLAHVAPAAQPPPTSQIELVPPATNPLKSALVKVHFCAAATVVILLCYIPLLPVTLVSLFFDNVRRRGCDFIVSWWARLTLLAFGSNVKVEGLENLPPPDEAVLYCPNHCSFLDIFALSGFLPRRFKYISKIEILRIPLVGWAMRFAKHIAIRRTDRASQLQTLKDSVECLKRGNSLVTFPEGTRSKVTPLPPPLPIPPLPPGMYICKNIS